MVKKLLQQQKRTKSAANRRKYSGRKPTITAEHRERMRKLRLANPRITLKRLREAVGLTCSVQAIHAALKPGRSAKRKARKIPPEPRSEQTA